MIRFFDILFSIFGLIISTPLMILLMLIIVLDANSPLFLQKRVGRKQEPFTLIKLRTMKPGTKSVASHMLSSDSVTSAGRYLRRTKLDELPQLWNVLKGEMSLVGPRPCLFSQKQLIRERSIRGVFKAKPGITGLAQIKGIDMSTPVLLAKTDSEMIGSLTLRNYFRYIYFTLLGKGSGDQIK